MIWGIHGAASHSARIPHGMVMSIFIVDGILSLMGIHLSVYQPIPEASLASTALTSRSCLKWDAMLAFNRGIPDGGGEATGRKVGSICGRQVAA